MAQNVPIGAADNPLGSVVYGNQSMIDYEEQAVGSNGFGLRMTACRIYHNWFTQVMTAAGLDETRLKSGHIPVISVSSPAKVKTGFTWHTLATTSTYDTDLNNAMARIAAEPFDAAVAGGSLYGGLNAALAYWILGHEIDRETPHPGLKLYPGDTPADYINSWIKCWNAWQTAATNAGVPKTRLRFCWNITVSNLSTADTFYPGDKYVDVIGFDPYAGSTGTSFSALCSAAFTYARKKNKPICFPEINVLHTADSAALQNWWIDAAAQINALNLTVEFLCIWPSGPSVNGGANYYQMNINKVADTNGHAFPLAHAGFLTMINNLGGNAIRSSVGQAKPAAPTGVSIIPASNGLTAAMSWTPNAGGDNVTSYNIYAAYFNVTSGGVKVASVNAPTTSLTLNTGPGQGYTEWVSAVNSAGEGPLSAPFYYQTPLPTTGQNPTVNTATAVVDASNAQQVDFSASATSPLSRPLTYSWTVTDSKGVVVDTFSGATVSRTYTTAGNYSWSLDVFDNGTPALHGAPVTGTVQLVLGSAITPLLGYNTGPFQPGQPLTGIGAGLVPIFFAQDAQLGGLLAQVGDAAEILGSVGQTFEPWLGSATNTCNLASGVLVWAKLKCHSTTLSSIDTITTQAQIGTGSLVAICDVSGNILTVDGTPASAFALFSGANVDAWLTHAAGDTTYQLDTAISGLSLSGQDLTIVVFSPPTTVTQYARFLGAPGPNNAAVANGNSALPLFGSATGQSTIPNPAPIGSGTYTACPKPLFVLNA